MSNYDLIGSGIDFNNLVSEPKLQVCKPNRKVIGNIVDFKGLQYKLNLGNINELTFSIPVSIDKDNQLIENPQLKLIKEHYYIKLKVNNTIYWFIIRKSNSIMSDNEEYKEFQCFSLAYELSNKTLRAYEVISHTANQVLTKVLEKTNWSIGYIDADYNLKYRAFNVSQSTVLDFLINDFVDTFGCLMIFDEQNRRINLYNPDNYGVNTGFNVSYGKLMKSVDKETDAENFCTVLNVYGRENLSIQRLNPTGSSYLEDFSFYMYPFVRDVNKNVVSHSDYMSDELCHAILDYKELVASKTGEFNTYTNELKTLQENLTSRYNELFDLQTSLKQVMDSLDIVNGKGVVTPEQQTEHNQLVSERNSLESQISIKNSQITTINNQITTKNSQINALRNSLKLENNFTPEQIIERNQFIVEKTWENSNYIDDESLYEAALVEFEKLKEPPILVKLDIVSLWDILEEQYNWNKLKLGDWITIHHERLNINIKAKIIEIDVDYDNYSVSLTISNETEILNDEERALRDIYRSASTSTTVNMNQLKWNGVESANYNIAKMYDILQGNLKEEINMAVNQNVDIGRRGIIIRDPEDPMNYLVAQNSVLAITNDNGNTWKNAITKDGVIAELIVGKLGMFAKINANQIVVSEDGTETTLTGISKDYVDERFTNDLRMTSSLPTSISMTSNGIRASTGTSNQYAQLDHRGLYINGGALQIDASNGKTNYITGEYIDVGNAGISNAGTLNSDIRLWAGSTYANRNNAPFRVTQNGQVTASNMNIVGGSINVGNFGMTSSGNITATNANITGEITANSGTFNGTIHADGGSFKGNITASGTITGGTIVGATLTTGASGQRVVMDSSGFFGTNIIGQKHGMAMIPSENVSASFFYYNGNVRGAIIADANTLQITSIGATSLQLGTSGATVIPDGNWNFSSANVTGLDIDLSSYATRSWVNDKFDDLEYDYVGSRSGYLELSVATGSGIGVYRNGSLVGTIDFDWTPS